MWRLGWKIACVALVAATFCLVLYRKRAIPHVLQESAPTEWFADVTQEMGLNFIHDVGPRPPEEFYMPQTVGSGAALFDFDNDGLLDLYLLNNGGELGRPNQLWKQQPSGKFENVSVGSGLDFRGYCMGVAVGDIDNDGLLDLLVTEEDGLRLFLNQGNGKFLDITKNAGLTSHGWATSASFFDYDRDGWLDLVVVNYLDFIPTRKCTGMNGARDYCGPSAFSGKVSRLYRNQGSINKAKSCPIRYDDVTVESGFASASAPGLGVICADFNGDRWPDVLIANDGKPNHLWINQKNGSFKEEGVWRGIAFNNMGHAEANMGIALGDVDRDGLFDIFVTHLNDERHRLWRQGPRGNFRDQSTAAGLTKTAWNGTAFGTVLADFDHDGLLDLALVNGHVRRLSEVQPDAKTLANLGPFWANYADRHQLLLNEGSGKFRDISTQNNAFCSTPSIGRGLAWGDINNDGAIDLVVTSVVGPALLFRNVAPKKGHWLMIRVLDTKLNRDAIGAEVRVVAGSQSWFGMVQSGSSYLCSNDMRVHFGLGSQTSVDALQVVWPDGIEEVFDGGPTDTMVILRKGEGRSAIK